jgi:hypothetical protein
MLKHNRFPHAHGEQECNCHIDPPATYCTIMLDAFNIMAEVCKVAAGIELWEFQKLLALLEGEKLKILYKIVLVFWWYAKCALNVPDHTIGCPHFSLPPLPPLPLPTPPFPSQPYPHHWHQELQAMHPPAE